MSLDLDRPGQADEFHPVDDIGPGEAAAAAAQDSHLDDGPAPRRLEMWRGVVEDQIDRVGLDAFAVEDGEADEPFEEFARDGHAIDADLDARMRCHVLQVLLTSGVSPTVLVPGSSGRLPPDRAAGSWFRPAGRGRCR